MGGAVAKRALDLTVSVTGLVLLSPLLLVAGLMIRTAMGPPILFRQSRPGLRGRHFSLLKLRTMLDPASHRDIAESDQARLTRLGRFLRSTSFDEIPELWNVIRGDMSLVGPRPLLMEYLPLYSPEQARRHEVRPGVTGWAQVNGRNTLSWEQKFEMDVWYVDHWSFVLDLRILWKTIVLVLRREGISASGHATMPPFTGSKGKA
jgi:sugar transferase EpsL